jgi:hypothetical protein
MLRFEKYIVSEAYSCVKTSSIFVFMCAFDSAVSNDFQDFTRYIWDCDLQNIGCSRLLIAHTLVIYGILLEKI